MIGADGMIEWRDHAIILSLRNAHSTSEMGQKPALPRRSIAVRFARNKRTPPESRPMFMLRLRHASHSASHRMQREPLNLKAELGVILYAPVPGAAGMRLD